MKGLDQRKGWSGMGAWERKKNVLKKEGKDWKVWCEKGRIGDVIVVNWVFLQQKIEQQEVLDILSPPELFCCPDHKHSGPASC